MGILADDVENGYDIRVMQTAGRTGFTQTEPVERITKKADELNIKVSLPPVGALVNDETVGSYTERWWNE